MAVAGELQLTYGELLEASMALARAVAQATPEGGTVGILLPSSDRYAVAILACLACGRPYVALDLNYPAKRNQEIIQKAELAVLVVAGERQDISIELPDGLHQIDIANAIRETGSIYGNSVPFAPRPVDEPAIILYTSGSSGHPKGIVNSQRALLQRVLQHVEASHIDSRDVFLLLSSFCTVAGTREALTALLTGAKLCIVDPETAGLRGIRRKLLEQGVSIVYAVPALIKAVIGVEEADKDFASLRVLRLGGDRVLLSDIALLRQKIPRTCHIQIGYSSTETTGAQWFVPPDFPQTRPNTPIGYILPGITFAVLDDEGTQVPAGEIGELVVRSPYVALGEWRNGRCESGAMIADPIDPGQRILCTGDLVRMEADGRLEVVGRKDQQIKINGKRVEPAELEALLGRSPHVADAAVIAVRSATATSLVAFVAPMNDAGAGLREELRAAIRTTLPPSLHPARLHIIDAIPRLPSAKINRLALEEEDTRRQDHDAAAELTSTIKAEPEAVRGTVERIWRKVLGGRAIAANRARDEAGGDSLTLLRFVFYLEEAFGLDLPLDHFRMNMTPGDFAATIARLSAGPATEAGNADGRPAVFIFPDLPGDNPTLASFRIELADRIRCIAIDYPGWRTMASDNNTIDDVAAAAVAQINKATPTGDLLFAGYSFGSVVGFLAAARLAEMGRNVAFFAILDTNISAPLTHAGQDRLPSWGEIWRTSSRLLRGIDSPHRRACQLLARWLSAPGRHKLLGQLAHTRGNWLPAATRFTLRTELDEAVRWRLFRDWVGSSQKPRIAGHAVLLRSEEYRPGAPKDLGWGNRFETVDVIDITGNHLEMLRPPHRAGVSARFAELVWRVRSRPLGEGTIPNALNQERKG